MRTGHAGTTIHRRFAGAILEPRLDRFDTDLQIQRLGCAIADLCSAVLNALPVLVQVYKPRRDHTPNCANRLLAIQSITRDRSDPSCRPTHIRDPVKTRCEVTHVSATDHRIETSAVGQCPCADGYKSNRGKPSPQYWSYVINAYCEATTSNGPRMSCLLILFPVQNCVYKGTQIRRTSWYHVAQRTR